MLAKMGPLIKSPSRRPVARSSSMTSVPVMSEGMRSGVNWMRLKRRERASASVLTSRVLASPGTPRSKQCPPAATAIMIWRTTSRWPMIAFAISPSSLTTDSCKESSVAAFSLSLINCMKSLLPSPRSSFDNIDHRILICGGRGLRRFLPGPRLGCRCAAQNRQAQQEIIRVRGVGDRDLFVKDAAANHSFKHAIKGLHALVLALLHRVDERFSFRLSLLYILSGTRR